MPFCVRCWFLHRAYYGGASCLLARLTKLIGKEDAEVALARALDFVGSQLLLRCGFTSTRRSSKNRSVVKTCATIGASALASVARRKKATTAFEHRSEKLVSANPS